MIKSIRFKNYKSFTDWTELNFKPITILVGPNSSGKSSILNLLKLILEPDKLINIASKKNRPNYKKIFKVFIDIDISITKNEFETRFKKEKKPIYKAFSFSYVFSINNKYLLGTPFSGQAGLLKFKMSQEDNKLSLQFSNKEPVIDEFLEAILTKNIRSSDFSKWPFVWNRKKIAYIINKVITNPLLLEKVKNIFDNYYMQLVKPSELSIKKIWPMDFNLVWMSDFENRKEKPENIISDLFYTYFYLKQNENENIKKLSKKIDEDLKFGKKKTIQIGENDNNYIDAIPEFLEEYDQIDRFARYYKIFEDKIIDQYFGAMIQRLIKLDEKVKFLKPHILKEEFINYATILIIGRFFDLTKTRIIELNKIKIKKLNGLIKRNLNFEYLPAIRDQLLKQELYLNISNDFFKKMFAELWKNSSDKVLFNLELINMWLKKFDTDYRINMTKSGRNKKLILIDIKTNKSFEMTDIGFGFSQFIPIILMTAGIDQPRKILIEQPEAQLHPKLQSRLADLFYMSAIKNKNQLFIETHSEYLIRRFQVLIAQGKMRPEDVVIYYVDKDENGRSHIREMELDETGQFLNEWPSGFFDESYKHAIEMLR